MSTPTPSTSTSTFTSTTTRANPFRSARLVYRAVELPADAWLFHALQSDPIAHANSDRALLRPQAKRDSEDYAKFVGEKTLCGVVVCLPSRAALDCEAEELTPIGAVHLTGAERDIHHHRNSTVGINILAGYRGKGYGGEAIDWIVDWGFRTAGLHRIGIGCWSYNDGAFRLYQRLGFVVESRVREAIWWEGGWHDILGLGMLEGEWRERREREKTG
jgi:RimJ/RimL family protein N-acetyltransferase